MVYLFLLLFQSVCNRLGIDAGDRLATGSKKRKFLVKSLPEGVVCTCSHTEV